MTVSKKTKAICKPLDIGQIGDASALLAKGSLISVIVELNTSEPARIVEAFSRLVPKSDRDVFRRAVKLLRKNERISCMTVPVGCGRIGLKPCDASVL